MKRCYHERHLMMLSGYRWCFRCGAIRSTEDAWENGTLKRTVVWAKGSRWKYPAGGEK